VIRVPVQGANELEYLMSGTGVGFVYRYGVQMSQAYGPPGPAALKLDTPTASHRPCS
jgi:hypothetical protein